MKKINRRQALQLGAAGSLLLPLALMRRGYAADAGSPKVKPFSLPFAIPPVLSPVRSDGTTDYYQIEMRKAQIEILPGKKTEVWGYNGMAVGPTIIQKANRQSVVRFINSLGSNISTTVHLHGMASEPQYDGYAHDLSNPGYYKDYVYPNNRAATLWYHDHAVHNTARNVYKGLAGMYLVQDQTELDLPLPKGRHDVPLVIQDKIFSGNASQLVYDDSGQSSLMGDTILVNGVPWPRMEVATRKYRFRVLNGSISRSYKLALSNGDSFTMIGTDAGLMGAPVTAKSFRIGMAERYEFIIDFSKYPVGTQIVLKNLDLPNNVNYDGTNRIMRFDVVRQETDTSSIPATLRPFTRTAESQAIRTRKFQYERKNGVWVINGKTWDPDRVDAKPKLGDYEIWTLNNNSGGWFHPIHIHLIDCQILDRNGRAPFNYEIGWKDVFYVGENETVRVIGRYVPHKGKYMSHCHNTVHEDFDMMNQFEVDKDGIDPLSVPPKPYNSSVLPL